jgi:predicted flap endonuclease-1-like 5' DNA nuclease
MRPVPPKPIGHAPEAELARTPRTQAHEVGYERERTRSGVFPVQAPAAITTRTLVEAEAELSRVARQMRARDAYLRELEQALRSSTQQLSAAGLGDIDQAAGLLGRLRGQAFRIAELQSELLQSAAQISELRGENRALRADNREDKPDDLRAIRGIGAHFARQLAELGVASFESIGNWNADDIARIAVQLRIPVARIERDTWIAQARELHAQRQR